mmetsp:Transcript_6969/g.30536  ORF Transcript_6969/g.30536 Transcript_6969/m.30536 type:complete len:229 (+) Transcript_6969:2091-2777(+)
MSKLRRCENVHIITSTFACFNKTCAIHVHEKSVHKSHPFTRHISAVPPLSRSAFSASNFLISRGPASHALHAHRQSCSMNPGFFLHSPALAHALHSSCLLSHPGGALGGAGADHRNGLAWIHFVAVHFVPPSTAHPPCRLVGSSWPLRWTLWNSSASPRRGRTCNLPRAHWLDDLELYNPRTSVSPSGSIHAPCLGNTVSPPASTSLRYINTVATRWPYHRRFVLSVK